MPSISQLAGQRTSLTSLLYFVGASQGRCMSLAMPTHMLTRGPQVGSLLGQPRHAHQLTSHACQACGLQIHSSSHRMHVKSVARRCKPAPE